MMPYSLPRRVEQYPSKLTLSRCDEPLLRNICLIGAMSTAYVKDGACCVEGRRFHQLDSGQWLKGSSLFPVVDAPDRCFVAEDKERTRSSPLRPSKIHNTKRQSLSICLDLNLLSLPTNSETQHFHRSQDNGCPTEARNGHINSGLGDMPRHIYYTVRAT